MVAVYGIRVGVNIEWSDRICTIVIDRPDKRNAVDLPVLHLLLEAQADIERRECRALVLTGSPPAFCSGADLADVEIGRAHV